jgi:hypothetical protein
MASPDIFGYWELSISFSIIFITLISIYLYVSSKPKRTATLHKATNVFGMGKNFVFVLVLISLLLFYIFSIQLARESSSGILPEVVFAIGNIVAEAFLIIYLLMNRKEESTQT